MPPSAKHTITDAQLGQALRRYLTEFRELEILKLPGTHAEPYVIVPRDDARNEQERTSEEAELSAPKLITLLDELFNDELDTGRALGVDELFDDDEGMSGFVLDGLSMGTVAAALHFAPHTPMPHALLAAVTAAVIPGHDPDVVWNDEPLPQAEPSHNSPLFAHAPHVFAHAIIDHLVAWNILQDHNPTSVMLNEAFRPPQFVGLERLGSVLATSALLGLAPRLFRDDHALLREVLPHLEQVTNHMLPQANPSAMALAFLTADYYTNSTWFCRI
jgi:hypothetical protein